MYSAESKLKQRSSALIISESDVISAEIVRDFNPGYLTEQKLPYKLGANEYLLQNS